VTAGERAVRYTYADADLIAIDTLDVQNAALSAPPNDAPGFGFGPGAFPESSGKQPLLKIRYAAGRVSDLELGDGRSYHFTFTVLEGSQTVTEAIVMAPDGAQTRVTARRRP
jgi:hypothetical protein